MKCSSIPLNIVLCAFVKLGSLLRQAGGGGIVESWSGVEQRGVEVEAGEKSSA